jgi:hypothetical protein
MLNFDLQAETVAAMKYFQYRIIASHMFDWVNLPAGLDSEKMELMLIDRGSVAFFNAEEGFYVLPYTSDGLLNVYGDLLSVRSMPYNGSQLKQLDDVPRILWDNSARQTFNSYLRAFADRLAFIQKSIMIVERQARFPTIAKVNEANKESFARFESKIDEGYPVIFVDDTFDQEAIKVFETGFRFEIFSALWNDYNKTEGEIYSLLGTMFNVEQNKAAGVGTAETVVNYSQTFAFANSRLKQRQRWCEKLNAEFGLGIWCEKANDYQDIVEEMMNSDEHDPKDLAKSAEKVEQEEAEDNADKQAGRLRTS